VGSAGSQVRQFLVAIGLISVAIGGNELRAQTAGRDTSAWAPTGLRPGDVLRLKIWREPDLSGDFSVDANGVAVLPRLGLTQVSAIPADSLQSQLTNSFREYLNNPAIEVTLLRRLAVLGAVDKPGLYPVDQTMTVADVLALAGGASADGKHDQVEVRRNGKRIKGDLSQSSRVSDLTLRSGDQIYVPQRSWISRNPWLFTSILGAAGAVTIIATRP
jgi:polysaccharide export outer membrane protein